MGGHPRQQPGRLSGADREEYFALVVARDLAAHPARPGLGDCRGAGPPARFNLPQQTEELVSLFALKRRAAASTPLAASY